MKSFKVTYTDGTFYITSANSKNAKEFENYLCQFGSTIVVAETEDGKEIYKTIQTVEEVN